MPVTIETIEEGIVSTDPLRGTVTIGTAHYQALKNKVLELSVVLQERILILAVLNEVEDTIDRRAQWDVGEVALRLLRDRDGCRDPEVPQSWIELLIKLRTALDECPMLEIESQKQCDRKCPVDPCMT